MSKYSNKRKRNANTKFQRPAQQDSSSHLQDGAVYEIRLNSTSDRKLADILYRQDRGHLHQYLGQKFDVHFDVHGANDDKLRFSGTPEASSRVKQAFAMLSGMVQGGAHIDKGAISSIAAQINPPKGAASAFKAANNNTPSKHDGGSEKGEFKPLNEAQATLSQMIEDNDLIFALGPAGTGKTHVAVVKAIAALKNGDVQKILLARPAAEAGEKIGYLPGDANAKLAPYMRPIYDELDKAFGPGNYKKMMEQGTIEIVPIGYMRGRTFDNAFIIVDEAQNTTIEQAKMAITRIGKDSKMVMTGDPMQIDLPNKANSGLVWASEIMKGQPKAATLTFEQGDVVRSEIVQTFINAVEAWEGKGSPAPAVEDDAPSTKKGPQNQPPTPGKW